MAILYLPLKVGNIIGKLMNQKVAWVKPEYSIVKGNSFTCCYVTQAGKPLAHYHFY
jgi:hypothetical protein